MSAAQHVASVTVEDGWMVARCSCGWQHRARPFEDVPAAVIYDYVLDHFELDHAMFRPIRGAA